MFRPNCLVYAASLALVGCNFAGKGGITTDDANNPHYKQAQDEIENHNPQGALADYQSALAENPQLAGAHYEMGIIYGDTLSDPVGAIYHFRKFLELSPKSDKAAEVKALIEKESQIFAASLPNSPAQSSEDYARLQSENAALKKQANDATGTITKLQDELAQNGRHHHRLAMQEPAADAPLDRPAPAPVTAPVIPVSTDAAPAAPMMTNAAPGAPMRATAVDTNSPDVNAPPMVAGTNGAPAAPAGPSKNYTVVKGDSIWKVAKKMYPGDTKNGEDKILGANPGLNPKRLKIGQVLIIPQ